MKNLALQPPLKLPCFIFIAGAMAVAGICNGATTPAASKPTPVAHAQPSVQENKGAVPEWKDPGKVLSEVLYDGLPIIDTGEDLRKKFDGEFDVLFPKAGFEGDSWDWTQTAVFLKLKTRF